MDETQTKLAAIAGKLLIGQYQRHVFMCAGQNCCTKDVGDAAWEALKNEVKDKGLSLSGGPGACYRTKASCLRVCNSGPIVVVYPEGTYYHSVTADKVPEFVQKHLIEGQPMDEHIFARNPLPVVESA